MAKREIVVLTDDLDGTEIADGKGETVTFALDGSTYEIDLTSKNADKMRAALQEYTSVARKVGRKTGTAGKRSSTTNAKEIRDWARSNGFPDIPDRGRIPADVMEAWDKK